MTRRTLAYLTMILVILLTACIPGSGNGSTPSSSAVTGDAATATRGVELTEIARLRGVASANVPGGTPSAAGSVTSPLIPTTASGSAPSGTVAAPATTRPAGTPAASGPPGSPTVLPTQIVKVTAEDGVNIRDQPDANAAIVLKADYGAEFPFLELDITGTDGTSHWVHINLGDKTGYIRKDLVSEPRAPSPPTPTPDPRTPTAAPSAAASPPAASPAAVSPTPSPKP